LGPRWNSPSFVSFSTQKNIINKKIFRKPNILCGILIWVYKLAKKISSHFDIGRVYMLHRGTCALSGNHDYTHRLLKFLWFKCIPVSYWSQNYSQACTCPVWRKHQVWDFPDMVCYFLRFNWIFARWDRLIIGWTKSTHKKIRNSAKLLHRI
jgi:hypothetical protein